jgi:hypothetical protein
LEVKKKGLPLSHQNKGTLFDIMIKKIGRVKNSEDTM